MAGTPKGTERMEYLTFTAFFVLAHVVAYITAGAITYPWIYKGWHGGQGSLYGAFLRDMTDKTERRRNGLLLLPTQAIRGVLMSMVLYPVLGVLGELSLGLQFIFMASLMYVYTDLSAATPFSNNIEGIIYMKGHIVRRAFWPTQVEAVLYASLMGVAAAWFVF
jgi:hypothetical protein